MKGQKHKWTFPVFSLFLVVISIDNSQHKYLFIHIWLSLSPYLARYVCANTCCNANQVRRFGFFDFLNTCLFVLTDYTFWNHSNELCWFIAMINEHPFQTDYLKRNNNTKNNWGTRVRKQWHGLARSRTNSHTCILQYFSIVSIDSITLVVLRISTECKRKQRKAATISDRRTIETKNMKEYCTLSNQIYLITNTAGTHFSACFFLFRPK